MALGPNSRLFDGMENKTYREHFKIPNPIDKWGLPFGPSQANFAEPQRPRSVLLDSFLLMRYIFGPFSARHHVP